MVVAEAERLHLSHEEVKRLTDEARAEFATREQEQHAKVHGMVLDASAHPELASAQFKLLVAQLSLIAKASGVDNLRQHLQQEAATTGTEQAVLAALAPALTSAPTDRQ